LSIFCNCENFLSNSVCSILIFSNVLLSSTAQRLALAAVGGRVDEPSKREKPKAKKKAKKRAAYPPSAARCVGPPAASLSLI
jgi:hypothetical protein